MSHLQGGYDPALDPARTRQPQCPRCRGRIVYVKSARARRAIPCEAVLSYGDGEKTLVTHDGKMIPKAPPEVLGREPHFGRNCPEGLLDRIEQENK